MKKYTFTLNNNNNNNTSYNPFYKSTDYSKILDDLILDDIIDKNSWLNYNKPSDDLTAAFITSKPKYTNSLGFDSDFAKAKDFLANYGKKTIFNYPFEKNKKYELSDGTIITITDDYIHINDKMYFFNLMDDTFFYNLTPKEKKTICTIYTDSLKITIKA